VRSQVALAAITIGLLALILNAGLLSLFLRQYTIDSEGTQIARQAAALSTCCGRGTALLLSLPGALDRAIDLALAGTPDRAALVVDVTGRLRYASAMPPSVRRTLLPRLTHDLTANSATTDHGPGYTRIAGQIVADARVASHGTVYGALLLAEAESVAAVQWKRTLILVVLSGVAAVALATLGSVVVAGAVARPIQALTATARGIARGDLTRRAAPAGPRETRELARSFNAMVDDVVHQQQVERDLLANVSHELAAPLGLIRGYAEALADGVIGGEAQRRDALQAIGTEAARLSRLSGDLLDLALLETGQVRVHHEMVPIGALLAGLRDRFGPEAERAGVVLALDVAPNLPPVETDGLRLEGVVVNLLTNALRHTPAGGTITLRADAIGAEVRVAVIDTGGGIAPQDLPRIWERFYRGDKGRDRRANTPGVGLGLAIVRSTVALLSGRIEVKSAAGAGTTFTVWLPRGPV
jgi:signal transduction histidine kinase